MKNVTFEIFESALYLKSGSMPLIFIFEVLFWTALVTKTVKKYTFLHLYLACVPGRGLPLLPAIYLAASAMMWPNLHKKSVLCLMLITDHNFIRYKVD